MQDWGPSQSGADGCQAGRLISARWWIICGLRLALASLLLQTGVEITVRYLLRPHHKWLEPLGGERSSCFTHARGPILCSGWVEVKCASVMVILASEPGGLGFRRGKQQGVHHQGLRAVLVVSNNLEKGGTTRSPVSLSRPHGP